MIFSIFSCRLELFCTSALDTSFVFSFSTTDELAGCKVGLCCVIIT